MSDFQYTQDLIRQMQLVELDMLKEVDHICRENQISYVADGGTLLGAVRHGGFIPWDDDVDIKMLRKDYDRFQEVCKDQLDPEKYFLQTYETDPGYRWGYARILKNGTVFVRQGHEMLKSKNGIFIDIFPVDHVPAKMPAHSWCNFKALFCRKMLYSEVGKKTADNWLKRAGFTILDCIPKQRAYVMLERMIEKYRDQDCSLVRCFSWGAREETIGFPKQWFEETIEIRFEDMSVKAPKELHAYLVHNFGEDYMTPPPAEQQKPKHTAVNIQFCEE